MSELMNTASQAGDIRRRLLATVSAAALAGSVYLAGDAQAESRDADRPTVWIELGGQLEALGGSPELFAPAFITKNLDAPYNDVSPIGVGRSAQNGFGGEGKISFRPEGSDWVFSAAVRYGRANRGKHLHQQSTTVFRQKTSKYNPAAPKFKYKNVRRFDDVAAVQTETHAIIDFMAGKDVGLGMFHGEGLSTFSFGVRIAQFRSHSNVGFKSFPDPHYSTQWKANDPGAHHHSYAATSDLLRSFRGIGPSISWDGAAPLIGSRDAGEVTFDWGANAAVLFGRNKVLGHHQTFGLYVMGSPIAVPSAPRTHYTHTALIDRSRSRIVPNAGGFAGVSVRYPNVKVSLGYRADFFFGAMDGGIDARKSVTPSFYGPFATLAIGLGG